MAAHNALRDMAMLARLAGEEALQAERFSLAAADDARSIDSHSCLRAFTQRHQLGHRIELWQPRPIKG
jgi:hypothetical protein